MKYLCLCLLISLVGYAYESDFAYSTQGQKSLDPCGLTGTINNRIQDCNTNLGNFALVTRNTDLMEVYRQNNNGLLWSHLREVGHDDNSLNEHIINVCNNNIPEVAGLNFLAWGLPTKDQFLEADRAGITTIGILKDSFLWSATTKRTLLSGKVRWVFYGDGKGARLDHNETLTGQFGFFDDLKIGSNSVICVARQ